MAAHTFSVVTVTMDAGPGGLRVRCVDLPGFGLTGTDRRSVADAVLPAIRALFESRGISGVTVHPVRPLAEMFVPYDSPASEKRRRSSDWLEPHRAQFVIEMPAARAEAAPPPPAQRPEPVRASA